MRARLPPNICGFYYDAVKEHNVQVWLERGIKLRDLFIQCGGDIHNFSFLNAVAMLHPNR